MLTYSASTRRYFDELKLKLTRLSEGVLKGKWVYDSYMNNHQISYTPLENEVDLASEIIATAVSDIIQKEAIQLFILRYFRKRTEFTTQVKKEIGDIFFKSNYIMKEEGASCISYYLIYVPILEFLEKTHAINLDGWIDFRMQKYSIILEDVMEQVIYDYETQEDYTKFLDFLKDIRHKQPSLEEEVHLYCEANGKIEIANKQLNKTTINYVDEYCDEIDYMDITSEDFMMHILIRVCPERIIIHKKSDYYNENFIVTIQEIFEEQVYIIQV